MRGTPVFLPLMVLSACALLVLPDVISPGSTDEYAPAGVEL